MNAFPTPGTTPTTTGTGYVSGADRLRQLPHLFTGKEAGLLFGWDAKTASQYLWMWKTKGWVQSFGGRSDVYANTLLAPGPNWEAALVMAMPTATIGGLESLRRAGWITQVPIQPLALIRSIDTPFENERYTVEKRLRGWWKAVGPEIIAGERGQAARQLPPAWALADLLRQHGWEAPGLHSDDIDWDAVTNADRAQWQKATAAFELPNDILESSDQPEAAEAMGCH